MEERGSISNCFPVFQGAEPLYSCLIACNALEQIDMKFVELIVSSCDVAIHFGLLGVCKVWLEI